MRIGITHRLFLAILGATCLALLCMFLVMHWNITRGFLQYLDTLDRTRTEHLVQTLGRIYVEKGGWEAMRGNPRLLVERLLGDIQHPLSQGEDRVFGHGPDHPPPPLGPPGMPFMILDGDRNPVFGGPPGHDEGPLKPIIVDNMTVGYAGFRLPPKQFLHPGQLRFLSRQKWVLIAAGVGIISVVTAFSIPLSRYLVKPLKSMADATRHLASGNYGVRIPVKSFDELGRLARSFNTMALTLEKNEKTRRQWIADISHELRTPLAVLQAEIEALTDGIRKTTPEAVRSLHVEVLRLHRLVDDLYQLSLSDLGALSYHREELDLIDTLKHAVKVLLDEFEYKGIAVQMDLVEEQELFVFGDRERLFQLFTNLLNNSLKYTDPGGRLIVGVRYVQGRARITFEDSHPGVTAEEIERLFDRLYRVENSRNRALGGAGLGLAICRNIVEAHEGKITASPSVLGGITVGISLPAEERMG